MKAEIEKEETGNGQDQPWQNLVRMIKHGMDYNQNKLILDKK
jgi:hypothetical protein